MTTIGRGSELRDRARKCLAAWQRRCEAPPQNNKNKRHLDGLERHLDGFRSQINVADAEPGGIMVK